MVTRSYKSNRYYESASAPIAAAFVPCWQCCVYGASDPTTNPYYSCAITGGVPVLAQLICDGFACPGCCYPGSYLRPTGFQQYSICPSTYSSSYPNCYGISCRLCGCWTPFAQLCSYSSGGHCGAGLFIRVG